MAEIEGFRPNWRGVFENWTRAYMKVHHWKIRHEMELEDAVQEGARIFVWCLRKTTSGGGQIDNEKWFMRYYQRAVGTWMTDTAHKSTERREGLLALSQTPLEASSTEQEGPLLAALRQDGSHELRTVLETIMNTPSEFFLRLLLRPGPDNIWSRRLCRLCGVGTNEQIIGELRRLLQR